MKNICCRSFSLAPNERKLSNLLTQLISCEGAISRMSFYTSSLKNNKAGYTVTLVVCGWAGAIFEVARPFGQELYAQRIKIIKKVKCDRPTDKQTEQGQIHGYPSRVRLGRYHIRDHWSIWSGAVRPKNRKNIKKTKT